MRRFGLLLLLDLLLLSVPGAIAAPVAVNLSVSKATLAFRDGSATVSIKLRTAASAETASLALEPSVWQDPNVFGSPLQTFDQQIKGAGRITGGFASSCCDYAAGASICQRGGPPDEGDGIDLALPAYSTTTVSYRVRLAAPPWPSPVFLGAAIGIPASAPDPSEISVYHFGPEYFDVRGRSGVQIRLAAGRGARRTHALYPIVPVRHNVTIAGSTNPRIVGAHLEIGYRSTTSRLKGTIGTTTTNQRGTFHIDWRPPVKGTYTITAAYRHPAAGLLADSNCDLALTAG